MVRIYPFREYFTPTCECTHTVNDHNNINLENPNKECRICTCPKFEEMENSYTTAKIRDAKESSLPRAKVMSGSKLPSTSGSVKEG